MINYLLLTARYRHTVPSSQWTRPTLPLKLPQVSISPVTAGAIVLCDASTVSGQL